LTKYAPKGIRNQGRPLKRLLEERDGNRTAMDYFPDSEMMMMMMTLVATHIPRKLQGDQVGCQETSGERCLALSMNFKVITVSNVPQEVTTYTVSRRSYILKLEQHSSTSRYLSLSHWPEAIGKLQDNYSLLVFSRRFEERAMNHVAVLLSHLRPSGNYMNHLL
jgi:hypothetical protein